MTELIKMIKTASFVSLEINRIGKKMPLTSIESKNVDAWAALNLKDARKAYLFDLFVPNRQTALKLGYKGF